MSSPIFHSDTIVPIKFPDTIIVLGDGTAVRLRSAEKFFILLLQLRLDKTNMFEIARDDRVNFRLHKYHMGGIIFHVKADSLNLGVF